MNHHIQHTSSSEEIRRYLLWFVFFLCLIFAITLGTYAIIFRNTKHAQEKDFRYLSQRDAEHGEVLSEFTAATASGSFLINSPVIIQNDITATGQTLDLGKNGTIIAGNIVTDLVEGTGIKVDSSGDQGFTVTNTDKGSDQKIFKNFIVNGTTLSALSNDDTIEFEAGSGLTLSASGNKVVISSSGGSSSSSSSSGSTTNIVVAGGGFVDNGTTVALNTTTDNVGIGKDAASAKVDILNTSNQVALSVQAASGQTADIAQFKKADGTAMITFDALGNANFNGTISQDGAEIKGSGIDFTGTGSTVSLNLQTDEPANLLSNPGVDTDLSQWTSDTPTATNGTTNGDFPTSVSGWTAGLVTGAYPENFSNTGFESNTTGWNFSGGGLYTETNFTSGFTGSPWAVTKGPDNNLWIAPFASTVLQKMTNSGTVTEYTIPGARTMNQDILSGPDGNLWFPAQSGNTMMKSTTAGVMTAFTTGGIPGDITAGPDGNIWYVITGKVGKMTTTGVRTEYTTTTAPNGIAAGPDGNMWYTTGLSNKVGKIALDGTNNVEYTTGTATDCRRIIPASDGNLYMGCWGNDSLAKVTTAGVVTNTGATGVADPEGLAEDNDGVIWFTANSVFKIGKYVPSTGVVTEYNTTYNRHVGATIGSDGNLYYTDRNNTAMSKFVITGPVRVTSPTHSSSAGALFIPSNAIATQVSQSVNLGNTKTYTLSAFAYIDGTQAVTSSQAQLIVNGSSITTTYTSVGGGWYQLSGTFTGSNSSVAYGVQVNSNQAVYLDNFSLKVASPVSYAVTPNYTSLGSAQVDAPSTSDVTLLQTAPFINTPYNITAKVYTNGSAVTTNDAQLYFNGAAIPTTIGTTGTAGWYQLSGTVTPTEGSYSYGLLVKANKTAYIDNVSTLISDVTGSVAQSKNPPTYNSSGGAVHINNIGRTPIKFYQSVTITTSGTYSLFARVYNDTPGEVGGAITSAKAKLVINGNVMSGVAYTPVTGDFYQLGASTFLSAGTYTVGIQGQSGYRIIGDAFSLQLGSGSDKNIVITNSGSGLATLNVESTTTANSGSADRQALILVASPNQTANLMEIRDSNANVLSVFDETGRLGIGTTDPSRSLVILKNDSSKQPVAFINTSNVDAPATGVLKLALGVATAGTDSRFIQFYANATGESDGTGVGRIRLNNGGVAYESGGADFAEYFAAGEDTFKPGEVVVLDNEGKVSKTFKPYDQHSLGVVSKTAAFVGNASDSFEATQSAKVVVGLVGQMDVQVSTLSGEIKKGDFLTTSSVPGVAMKAIKRGLIMGMALDDFKPATGSATTCSENIQSLTSCGSVRAYISPRWIDPNEDGDNNALAALSDKAPTEASVSASQVRDDLTVMGHTNLSDVSITGNLSVGLLNIQGITDDTREAAINTLSGDLLLQSQAAGGIRMINGRILINKDGTIELKQGNLEVSNGVIKGNDKFVGIEKLEAGKDTVTVKREWDSAPTNIQVVPDYNTTIWVTDVSTKGFVIHVGSAHDKESQLRWSVLFK